MKKIFISISLFFFLISGINYAEASNTIDRSANMKATILQWSLFSKSQALKPENGQGGSINCSLEKTRKLIDLNNQNEDAYKVEIEALKSTDPGYVQDIRGCIMEEKIDGFISWIIYLSIISLILVTLWKVVMSLLGGSKSTGGGGWDEGGGDSSGGGDVMKEIKPLLVAMSLLFLLLLGTLNFLLKLVAWGKDTILG